MNYHGDPGAHLPVARGRRPTARPARIVEEVAELRARLDAALDLRADADASPRGAIAADAVPLVQRTDEHPQDAEKVQQRARCAVDTILAMIEAFKTQQRTAKERLVRTTKTVNQLIVETEEQLQKLSENSEAVQRCTNEFDRLSEKMAHMAVQSDRRMDERVAALADRLKRNGGGGRVAPAEPGQRGSGQGLDSQQIAAIDGADRKEIEE
jgi:hypothetical protein